MRFKVYLVQGTFLGEMTREGISALFAMQPNLWINIHGGPQGNAISGEMGRHGWNDYLELIASK